jgi:hypothetical protein
LYETIQDTQAFFAVMKKCHRNVTTIVLESFFGSAAYADTVAPAQLPFSAELVQENSGLQ